MTRSHLPQAIQDLNDLRELESMASRHETTFGPARMVWHRWGRDATPSSGLPPVVLIHGGSGSWTHWCRNIAALVDAGRTVWVPDLPGFGDSDAIDGVQDADGLPEPLAAAINELMKGEPVDVVAFSFGGMVATLMAQQNPQGNPVPIRRLCLVGVPALGITPRHAYKLRPWAGLPEDQARAMHRFNLRALMLSTDEAVDELAVDIQAMNVPRDRIRKRVLSRTDIIAQALPGVQVPLYGIWGAEDVLYKGLGDELEQVLRRAPNFRRLVRLPDTGHWAQYQNAPVFDAALARTLND